MLYDLNDIKKKLDHLNNLKMMRKSELNNLTYRVNSLKNKYPDCDYFEEAFISRSTNRIKGLRDNIRNLECEIEEYERKLIPAKREYEREQNKEREKKRYEEPSKNKLLETIKSIPYFVSITYLLVCFILEFSGFPDNKWTKLDELFMGFWSWVTQIGPPVIGYTIGIIALPFWLYLMGIGIIIMLILTMVRILWGT